MKLYRSIHLKDETTGSSKFNYKLGWLTGMQGLDQNQKLTSCCATKGPQRCVTYKEDVTTGIIIELSNNRISESDRKEIVALNPGEKGLHPLLNRIQ